MVHWQGCLKRLPLLGMCLCGKCCIEIQTDEAPSSGQLQAGALSMQSLQHLVVWEVGLVLGDNDTGLSGAGRGQRLLGRVEAHCRLVVLVAKDAIWSGKVQVSRWASLPGSRIRFLAKVLDEIEKVPALGTAHAPGLARLRLDAWGVGGHGQRVTFRTFLSGQFRLGRRRARPWTRRRPVEMPSTMGEGHGGYPGTGCPARRWMSPGSTCREDGKLAMSLLPLDV
ncbi:hypothetical protein CPAR01_13041 [Colletotrichum paranaense]|uniref:Secreted protein n=1 Tax=Colletotrichum paranaense TaxID=1914294 RepID=A0ABQ9S4U5_9PEZI|nr:uncharacterized protein CPAR01_13041 [Colletotrichum paranaense]KAK1526513.1 hypothetical protein CPAR01_13041 [Colletotrichum paranaense]KAK1713536.1 hypothetical protein BDP67DRAFT_40870 [Colletotrichum lupini]